jgi:MFS family permease
VIFVDLLPLQKRPKYQGLVGATFGLASIAGPLLGGLFTSKVNWRWCFWINLPIGGVAVLVLFLVLPRMVPPREHRGEPFWRRVRRFDPVGTALLLPGLVLVLLGLQWGGNGYAWGSTRVVVSLVVGLVLLVGFGFVQWWVGDNGTVPSRILTQQSIAAGSVVNLGFGSALTILTFYLPIWFQAIKGLSAFGAGIRLLPYFLGTVVFVIGSGFVISKTGYYNPPLILGTALMVVGGGLLTTFRVDTSTGEYIGFEVSLSF